MRTCGDGGIADPRITARDMANGVTAERSRPEAQTHSVPSGLADFKRAVSAFGPGNR
jgi:hypothetical protein